MNCARRAALLACALAGLAGCASWPANVPENGGSLIPAEGKVQVTQNVAYSYEELAVAPVVIWSLYGILDRSLDQLGIFKQPFLLYFVYQPFAPNWSLEEARLDEQTYYVRLLAKRFRTGGDGEAMMVIKRRALQLQHERGYAGYRILDYAEGIESSTPVAQRFSHAVVQLVRAEASSVPSASAR